MLEQGKQRRFQDRRQQSGHRREGHRERKKMESEDTRWGKGHVRGAHRESVRRAGHLRLRSSLAFNPSTLLTLFRFCSMIELELSRHGQVQRIEAQLIPCNVYPVGTQSTRGAFGVVNTAPPPARSRPTPHDAATVLQPSFRLLAKIVGLTHSPACP